MTDEYHAAGRGRVRPLRTSVTPDVVRPISEYRAPQTGRHGARPIVHPRLNPVPSKGEVQAARERDARRTRARVSIHLAVEESLEAGLAAVEIAHAFAEVLRRRGLLQAADQVVTSGRRAKR
jgi:hypothetical protein